MGKTSGGGGGGGKGKSISGGESSAPEVDRTIDSVQMSPLQGSEKQVAWAEQIRNGFAVEKSQRRIDEAEARFKSMKDRGMDTEFERNLLSLRYKVENTIRKEAAKMTSAKELIDNRKDSTREKILRQNLKNLDSEFLRKAFPKPSDFLRWAV